MNRNDLTREVRRVGVSDPVTTASPYDYADAFELHLPCPDLPPRVWLRAGLMGVPKIVGMILSLLGYGQKSSLKHARTHTFRTVASGPEMAQLEVDLPLMHVTLVGRTSGPNRRTLTTVLRYRRPLLARVVWTFVGVGHRRVVPRILASKVASNESDPDAGG